MRILYISGALMVLCVLSVLGHKLQGHDHGHSQVKKISFSVKHDEHKSPDHGDHGHKHHDSQHHGGHHEHKVEHHEHHVVHHESHGHDKHQGHHEHHGNNGHGNRDHHDHGHAKYEFKYGVKDYKTGDLKQQWEARDGDKVKGVYSLKEADGTKRIVEYSADKKKGFEATVHKIGHAHHDLGHHQDGAAKLEHQVQEDHAKHDHHHNSGHGHASSFIIVKKQSKH